MKFYRKILAVMLPLCILFASQVISLNEHNSYSSPIVFEQIRFDPNNIDTWLWNTGVFDQNRYISNAPGFQWPKGSGKFAVFTAGLTIGAFVNGTVRLAAASYVGEYAPGYVADSSGVPVGRTDARFKFYKVKRGDNWISNPDWLNWGLMIPFGAPYVDVNHSGYYEPIIDTPGIRGAVQTIFICLTDGFPEEHKIGEGFAGGTLPLYAEAHLTAWGYDNPGYQDIQFLTWEIVNRNIYSWDSTYFAIVSDADLGYADDDYLGCDTVRNLSYCYNADNFDGDGMFWSYGANPPAVGFIILRWATDKYSVPPVSYKMTSSVAFHTHIGECEYDPVNSYQAHNYLKGFKRDGTPWVVANTNPPQVSKFIFSGDPETNQGWTEYGGWVANCGSLYGPQYTPSPAADRKMVVSSGARNLKVNPGDTQKIVIAQLIARGSNNKNSVTLLKQLADVAIELYNSGFVIGVENISTEIPNSFKLYQNYPNPFNPVTKIKFSLPLPRLTSGHPSEGEAVNMSLIVYDVLGREVAVLVNENLKAGTYETDWDASSYPSGVYFYKLITDSYSESKKMILMK